MSKVETKRISADIPVSLSEKIDAALKALHIKSRSALIEVSCRAFLEDANLHEKIKGLETQLKLARAEVKTVTRGRETARNERDAARAELADMKSQCDPLRSEINMLAKHFECAENGYAILYEVKEQLKQIAGELGVPDTVAHIRQRIGELDASIESLESQRDDFEEKLHAETDAYNKCYERAESQKKARDYFKVKYEASQAEAAAAKSKLAAYQKQGFWGRLFRQLPIPIPYVEPME